MRLLDFPAPKKYPKAKSIQEKALRIIEDITCNDDFNDNPTLVNCYKYSHVANGHCNNEHLDWIKELESIYQSTFAGKEED